jgi:hypothetical protein
MKQFAALTTVLLATVLVSPMVLAKNSKPSTQPAKASVSRSVKASFARRKTAHTKIGHPRKSSKHASRKPESKTQPIQPIRA